MNGPRLGIIIKYLPEPAISPQLHGSNCCHGTGALLCQHWQNGCGCLTSQGDTTGATNILTRRNTPVRLAQLSHAMCAYSTSKLILTPLFHLSVNSTFNRRKSNYLSAKIQRSESLRK